MVCDGSGLGAAWHLDSIVVTNMVTQATARFEYKDWFDNKKGWSHTLYSGQGAAVVSKREGGREGGHGTYLCCRLQPASR